MRRVALFALASCATLGTESKEIVELPSAGVGPFRKLALEEVRTAPYVFDDPVLKLREPAVLSSSSGTEVILYASGAGGIYRTRATDARSFYGTAVHTGATPALVLAPTHAWEGGAIGGPSALSSPDGVWLYYAAKGGIGLARSADGLRFASMDAPVLALEGARAPSVAKLPDGSFHMFYERAGRIEEAESASGAEFRPLGVALEPSGAGFDADGVGDPCVTTRETEGGRLLVRVLYTGRKRDGASAIGFAARYGPAGPLSRNASPVYSSGVNEAPALFEWTSEGKRLSLLYDTEPRRMDGYPVIAAALAPVDATLPPPTDYPSSP